MVYEAQVLSADMSCSISITSLSDPECGSPIVATGAPLSSAAQSFSVGGIAGVAVAAGVVIVVVLVFVVALVLKCRKRSGEMDEDNKMKQSTKE